MTDYRHVRKRSADFTTFLHDRDPVLYPTKITTLTKHARQLFIPS